MDLAFDTRVLATFTLLWLAIVPTPGANSLLVTQVAITRQAADVGLVILGNMLGIAVLGGGALLGWATVLEIFPGLRLAVNILGGAYLVYFGCRLLWRSRQGRATSASNNVPAAATATPGALRTIGLGFVTALSNAQAIVFVTSIFALTGILQANAATGIAALAIMIGCNASYLSLLGWLFQRPAVRTFYARFRYLLDATFGALFIAFGGRLIWRELAR